MAKQLYGYALIASKTTRNNMTKLCTGCNKRKSLEKFSKNKMGKHGRSSKCKVCISAYEKSVYVSTKQTHRKCVECEKIKAVKFFTGKKIRCNKCAPLQQYDFNAYKKKWHIHTRGKDIKEYIFDVLSKSKCKGYKKKCKENDVLVLEFDHIKGKKLFNIGQAHMDSKMTIAKLKKEIAKCQVLCSNCHKRKTAQEQDTWRYQKATGKL